MAGQPSIYKIPKEMLVGARPLLKRVQYAWWPPKEFQNATIGQFDIYPEHKDVVRLSRILSSNQSAQSVSSEKDRKEERKSKGPEIV